MHSIRHIATETEGTFLQFSEDDMIAWLLTDSRRLIFPEATLFFALRGERRSGQSYLADLYRAGVRNFVVYENIPVEEFPDANILLVHDTIDALQRTAAFHRRAQELPVIGITGSNGKTIVKEWLNQMLEDAFTVVRSPRSFNSQIGVPLSVWQIGPQHDLGIFEAGISRPGEMSRLENVIRPTIGVLTHIGAAHDEGFDGIASKISEKLQLFNRADLLVFGADDERVTREIDGWHRKRAGAVLFSWGRAAGNRLVVREIRREEGRTTLALAFDEEPLELSIGFSDDASLENALTCIATVLALTGTTEGLQTRLDRLDPLAMRMELKTGIHHCTLINDSWSADMHSLRLATDLLAQQTQHAKRTAILSDIPESGRDAAALYAEVAQLLRVARADRLIAVGLALGQHRDVLTAAVPTALFYPGTEALLADLPFLVFRDEAILLKGARSFSFEKIDHLLSLQAHETILEVSREALAHNLKQYQRLLKPETRVMAMVKAFSYGAGSYEIARELQFHCVDYLGVAYVDEGVALRRAGITLPVMIMNTEDESLDHLIDHRLEPVVYSFRILDVLERHARAQAARDLPVHIEFETGMNRLGFSPADLPLLAERLASSPFRVVSAFSHLAASDEADQDAFTAGQAAKYVAAADALQAAIGYPFLRHLSNSAAIARHPELQFDMVRLGIGLYGFDSAGTGELDLRQVGTLRSTIAQIRFVAPSETVGYNRRGVNPQATKIATVRIGYADGYPRSLGNGRGKMWLRGRLAPTVGSICMDMTMVDITGVEGVQEGDEILVFGEPLPVAELAHWAGTIPYEILTGVSQRVKRLYVD